VTLESHDAWRFKALLDPVTLLQVVDEHVFQTDVLTVNILATITPATQQLYIGSLAFPC